MVLKALLTAGLFNECRETLGLIRVRENRLHHFWREPSDEDESDIARLAITCIKMECQFPEKRKIGCTSININASLILSEVDTARNVSSSTTTTHRMMRNIWQQPEWINKHFQLKRKLRSKFLLQFFYAFAEANTKCKIMKMKNFPAINFNWREGKAWDMRNSILINVETICRALCEWNSVD